MYALALLFPVTIFVALAMWLRGGTNAVIGKMMVLWSLVVPALIGGLILYASLQVNHSIRSTAPVAGATTGITANAAPATTVFGQPPWVIGSGAGVRTPVDLMNLYVTKHPNAAGYSITRVQVSDRGPWKDIKSDADVHAYANRASFVVDYRTATGTGAAGFELSGADWPISVVNH
jgi:hypothetical protein